MKRTLVRILAIAALALGTTTAMVTQAQASPAPHALAAQASAPEANYTSSLTITFKDGRILTGAAAQRAVTSVKPDSQPSGAYLYCNQYYGFSDSNGTYHFQHACGGSTGPWGYNISAADCSIAVGPVSESGMSWTRNGVKQGTQSPHEVSCAYTFHGTYNPDRDYDFLTYSDNFVFDVEVDGDPGTANLHVTGSFTSAGCTSGKTCGQAVIA